MAGRHRKADYFGGRVRPGPGRWARAAANALAYPNSDAGRLYLHRTALAFEVSETSRMLDKSRVHTAYAFMNYHEPNLRDFATCSVFCTVMQVQLTFSAHDMKGIRRAFEEHRDVDGTEVLRVHPLDRSALTRTLRCQVCGGGIRPKKRGRS
jgi:hypothetical protein